MTIVVGRQALPDSTARRAVGALAQGAGAATRGFAPRGRRMAAIADAPPARVDLRPAASASASAAQRARSGPGRAR
jgi:hypothetical protein